MTNFTNLYDLISNGFIFGFIDNGIVVASILGVAFFAGLKLSPDARATAWKVAMTCALVGALGNAASDFVGCMGDPTMWDSVVGITAGCMAWPAILITPKVKQQRRV